MSETPSARRRKGRNDYEPGVDPMDVQPYTPGTWAYDYHLQDYLDGWNEADEVYNASIGEFDGCSGWKYPKECPHEGIYQEDSKDCKNCCEDAMKAMEEINGQRQ